MLRRSALRAPFQVLAIDLLTAVSIALMALSLVIAPVLAQDPTAAPSPAAVVTTPAASLAPGPSAAASPVVTTSSAPLASAAASLKAAVPPVASPSLGASPEPSLASGAHSAQEPCPDSYAPSPGATRDPKAPPPNLCPAQPAGADPLALISWVFTPIFQVIFLGLAFFYSITGDIGVAIILLTILIRILLIPVFRAQIVSQRRMQMLQPELRAIQAKYKGDRARISAEQMQLYKDRGVNPASGCLPSLLQLVLLMPMYQVFSQGLKAPDISSMLSPFGITLVNVTCYNPADASAPCINPDIPWLAWLPTLVGNGPIIPGYPGGLPANAPGGLRLRHLRLRPLAPGTRLVAPAARPDAHDDDPQRRPPAAHAAAHVPVPAVVLAALRWHPASRPLHLLDHHDHLQHRPAVPHQRLRWAVPALRLDATLRRRPHAALPGEVAATQAAVRHHRSSGASTQTTQRSTSDSAAGTIRPARRRSSRRGRRR